MSIDGEQEIRKRLGEVLGTVAVGPAPVERAVRQGRAIRARRRLAAIAGAAVAAAAAVAVPLMLRQPAAPNAVTPRPWHHTVTVHPPGPHAPAGLIAWGRVDRRRWAVRVSKPDTSGPFKGSQFVSAFGSRMYQSALTAGQDPVSFQQLSAGPAGPQQAMALYGPVRADVAYVTARLSDGTVLTLHPVRAFGVRFVAFAAPTFMISKVTAYSARGVLASAVPLHGPRGAVIFATWLRPGQAGRPRHTWVIGASTTAGVSWSIGVYQGPWGYCILTIRPRMTTSDCYNHPAELNGSGVIGQGGSDAPQLIWGIAPPRAAHVVVVMSDRSRVRVRTVSAGQIRYFAFAVVSTRLRVNRWMAYDQARQAVGHG